MLYASHIDVDLFDMLLCVAAVNLITSGSRGANHFAPPTLEEFRQLRQAARAYARYSS